MKIKPPQFVPDTLSPADFKKLKRLFYGRVKKLPFDPFFSRYYTDGTNCEELSAIATQLLPKVRELFGKKNILPTYQVFVHYEGANAKLPKHVDDNACTYTLDLCVYQKTAWPLWVDGKPYVLNPNESLAYYGNDQLHWREEFPDKSKNQVAMVFFHFAEPHHWYFTKGSDHILKIRQKKLR